jgi:uncharacterized protein involved in response to NO
VSPRSLLATSAAPAQTLRPALLAKGFRPFFLLAAALAVVALPVWLAAFAGSLDVLAYLGPMYWHAHEMVFGFAGAVIAGFLLTAVSNWTGRDTAVGRALGALALLWLAGRAALLVADLLPRGLAAGIDLAFLPALAITCARPIIATRNHRNLGFIVMLAALWLANVGVHLGALGVRPEWLRLGNLVGVDLVILAIVLVSGRVVPMFTRNATKVDSIRNIPVLDRAAIAGVALLVLLDASGLAAHAATAVAGITGALTLARTAFWGARHTANQPLLWILHLGHAFIPIGLLLRAASALFTAIPSSSALHALTAGAIGAVTLGMMTRVGLGHTGRMLAVPRAIAAAFAILLAGAALRVVAPFFPVHYVALVTLSGILWAASFATYLATYAGALVSPRVDGKPG